jgi:putative FmdB family regulatory protein
MPIYEYKCSKCEAHFEKMQKISEEPLKVCETCGGTLEKQWSLSGFQFKGAGWYVTDYANKGKAEAKSEGKSPAAAVPDAKSDGTASSSEKSSAGESTARTESASNTSTSNATKPDAPASKKE